MSYKGKNWEPGKKKKGRDTGSIKVPVYLVHRDYPAEAKNEEDKERS